MDVDIITEEVCSNSQINKGELSTIRDFLFQHLNNVEDFYCATPRIVCIGGAPGVGKSTFSIGKYRNFFIINPDSYRHLFYDYSTLDTENIISVTSSQVTHLCEILIECLSRLSCNILIEDTFANYSYWDKHLRGSQFDKYKMELILLSAPVKVCYESAQDRYCQELKEACQIPRKVDINFIIDRMIGLSKSVRKYSKSDLFYVITFMYKNCVNEDFVQIDQEEYLSILDKTLCNEIF